jgi:hypothetical protein
VNRSPSKVHTARGFIPNSSPPAVTPSIDGSASRIVLRTSVDGRNVRALFGILVTLSWRRPCSWTTAVMPGLSLSSGLSTSIITA